jgi:Tn3 transposase DDE domain-containing protein
VINAIAVWKMRYFERAQVALARQGVPVPEHVWQHLSTLQWAHIHLNGSYHFTDITLNADFRPLREYQGPRLLRSARPSVSERADAATTPTPPEVIPN